MVKIKLTAGSKYIHKTEAQAIERLQHLLVKEDGYLIPVLFIGKQVVNREIDAILLLPDAIFLLDFKQWAGERIIVEGINGSAKRLRNGKWEEGDNSLPDYEYAARELASRLKRNGALITVRPHIYSAMVFTNSPASPPPQVSFAGGDPRQPKPRDGVCACHIEQVPQMIAAFRAAGGMQQALSPIQLKTLTALLLSEVQPPVTPHHRRIEGYVILDEHHVDAFLNCKIYLGEGEPIREPVWIKEYDQVLASPDQRMKREQLILRHADILHRFPQHRNIVNYRVGKSTTSHLYIILTRQPGAFLSELLTQHPLGLTTGADLQHIPFDLHARLLILGDLLKALEYLTLQPGFARSAYRDLRPDNIFVQHNHAIPDSLPIAQLFNFDCTKLPGATTKREHLKAGLKRFPVWDDYASPELLSYVQAEQDISGTSFTGDVSSDLFSWGVIAWELLTGDLPFSHLEAKLAGKHHPWPTHLAPALEAEKHLLPSTLIQLIQACLGPSPTRRPSLKLLRSHLP